MKYIFKKSEKPMPLRNYIPKNKQNPRKLVATNLNDSTLLLINLLKKVTHVIVIKKKLNPTQGIEMSFLHVQQKSSTEMIPVIDDFENFWFI